MSLIWVRLGENLLQRQHSKFRLEQLSSRIHERSIIIKAVINLVLGLSTFWTINIFAYIGVLNYQLFELSSIWTNDNFAYISVDISVTLDILNNRQFYYYPIMAVIIAYWHSLPICVKRLSNSRLCYWLDGWPVCSMMIAQDTFWQLRCNSIV